VHTQLAADIPSEAELQVAKESRQGHVAVVERQDSNAVLKELDNQ